MTIFPNLGITVTPTLVNTSFSDPYLDDDDIHSAVTDISHRNGLLSGAPYTVMVLNSYTAVVTIGGLQFRLVANVCDCPSGTQWDPATQTCKRNCTLTCTYPAVLDPINCVCAQGPDIISVPTGTPLYIGYKVGPNDHNEQVYYLGSAYLDAITITPSLQTVDVNNGLVNYILSTTQLTHTVSVTSPFFNDGFVLYSTNEMFFTGNEYEGVPFYTGDVPRCSQISSGTPYYTGYTQTTSAIVRVFSVSESGYESTLMQTGTIIPPLIRRLVPLETGYCDGVTPPSPAEQFRDFLLSINIPYIAYNNVGAFLSVENTLRTAGCLTGFTALEAAATLFPVAEMVLINALSVEEGALCTPIPGG